MSERYYLEKVSKESDFVVLEGDEARHLSRVMRKKVGEEVELFDGVGSEYSAVIEKIIRDQVVLSILNRRNGFPEKKTKLVLAVALPKGDRQKWMIEKLTELGCSTLIPLKTQFGVAKGNSEVLNRLRRGVIEASKQCRRSSLMQITEERTIEEVMSNREYEGIPRMIAHPVQQPDGRAELLTNWIAKHPDCRQIMVLIGPEGGFSDDEIRYVLANNGIPVHFGSGILRTETAAIAACSLCCLEE